MDKSRFLLITIAALLVVALVYLNPFNLVNMWQAFPTFATLALIIIYFTSVNQYHFDSRYDNQTIHFENLDILKYGAAILIIILHLRPFLNINPTMDLIFNNLVSRICVPIFLVSSGFFATWKQQKEPGYIDRYIHQSIPLYLFYSLIYLPVGISWLSQYFPLIESVVGSLGLSGWMNMAAYAMVALFGLIIALLYTGTYYHLWYYPALLISLKIVDVWIKHFHIKYLLYISFVLLFIGSFETYYGILPLWLQWIMDQYFKIFITTRNFVFFGLFYTTLGYTIFNRKAPLHRHALLGLGISVALMIIEVIALQYVDRKNSNILLSAVPCVYFLFLTALYTKPWTNIHFRFRDYSKYYYLIHPMIIFVLQMVITSGHTLLDHPWLYLVLTILITHGLSMLILELKKKYPRPWY